jgi:hypothetical protein
VKAPDPSSNSRRRHRSTWADTHPPGVSPGVRQPPAPENLFHIMEFARNFSCVAFPFAEKPFRIAK